jgi:hypothetical protein
MSYDKRIVTAYSSTNPTRDEFTSPNGFILSANTYQHSIAFLNELAVEAKRDFPCLTDNDIEVVVVARSGYNQGFWGIRFSLPEGTSCKDGYRAVSRLDFSYL